MSKEVFETGVKQNKAKFEALMSGLCAKSLSSVARSRGVTVDALKEGLQTNSDTFQNFCKNYAKSLMPGKISQCGYAVVVASIASRLGVPYKSYTGFALRQNDPRYEMDKAAWQEKAAQGEICVFFANHFWTEVNGKVFEYFNGDTEAIDHLDVVEIAGG